MAARYVVQLFQSSRKKPRWRWRVVDKNDCDDVGRPRGIVASIAGWTAKADCDANLQEAARALERAVLCRTAPRRGYWRWGYWRRLWHALRDIDG